MDKSFNDDELADIMNEIENLEKEFSHQDSSPSISPTTAEENEVLASLVEQEPEKIIPQKKEDNIISFNKNKQAVAAQKSDKPSHSMSFHLEGEMSIDLNFCIHGEEIQLKVGEDGLSIQMPSGATFNLPIVSSSASTVSKNKRSA